MSHEAAREVHALIDEAIRHLFEHGRGPDGEKATPSCQDRCPSCCYEPVYAERSEALLLAASVLAMAPERRAAVVARARSWLDAFRASPLSAEARPDVMAWRRLRLPCPMLEDGRCSAYDARPVACRTHVALGPRKRCEDQGSRRDQVFLANNDFMASAITKLAAGLQQGGKAVLLMDHLGALLAEALTGERAESGARQELPVAFEDVTESA